MTIDSTTITVGEIVYRGHFIMMNVQASNCMLASQIIQEYPFKLLKQLAWNMTIWGAQKALYIG